MTVKATNQTPAVRARVSLCRARGGARRSSRCSVPSLDPTSRAHISWARRTIRPIACTKRSRLRAAARLQPDHWRAMNGSACPRPPRRREATAAYQRSRGQRREPRAMLGGAIVAAGWRLAFSSSASTSVPARATRRRPARGARRRVLRRDAGRRQVGFASSTSTRPLVYHRQRLLRRRLAGWRKGATGYGADERRHCHAPFASRVSISPLKAKARQSRRPVRSRATRHSCSRSPLARKDRRFDAFRLREPCFCRRSSRWSWRSSISRRLANDTCCRSSIRHRWRRRTWHSTSARSRCSFSRTARVLDATTKRWRGVRPDTVRGWHVVAESSNAFTGWVDDQGRVLRTTQLGFGIERLPYEVAFENWRTDTTRLSVTARSRYSRNDGDRRQQASRPARGRARRAAAQRGARRL